MEAGRASWRHNKMVGFTSSGVGVSGTRVRFLCPPEICIFTLKRLTGCSDNVESYLS